MKILIISQFFYPEAFRINDLVKALTSRGHDVEVLTGMPNYPHGSLFKGYGALGPWREVYSGATVYRVPIIPRGRGGKVRLCLNYLSFIVSATLLGLPRLRAKKYDGCLVFASSPITSAIPANIFRLLSGCPLAIWIQDLWPDVVVSVGMVRNPKMVERIGHITRWIYQHTDLLLIQSEGFRKSVMQWGGRVGHVIYLPNWAEDFYRPKPKTSPALPFRILFAGNLGRAQALETVVQAICILKQRNSPIEWHFMGDGSMRDWLEEQINEHGLSDLVKILPRQPEVAMPDTFANYSALLISLARDPVMSLVLPSKTQSSLACGMPVLVSADGEVARTVNEAQCGLVSPADEAQGLAENAMALSELPAEDLSKMGKNGRTYYEKHFARDLLLDKMISCFEDMKNARGGR